MSTKKAIGWDAAIADAKKKIEKLETVISICEEKKAKGDPWPGTVTKLQSAGVAITRHTVTNESATHNYPTTRDAQKDVGRSLRDILFQGAALSARVLKFKKNADIGELAIAGTLAVGLVRSVRHLIEKVLQGGPHQYLTEVKKAENEFLRLTFPLGLER